MNCLIVLNQHCQTGAITERVRPTRIDYMPCGHTLFNLIASINPTLPFSSSPSIKKITFASKAPSFNSSWTAITEATIGP